MVVGLVHNDAATREQFESDKRDTSGDDHRDNIESDALGKNFLDVLIVGIKPGAGVFAF